MRKKFRLHKECLKKCFKQNERKIRLALLINQLIAILVCFVFKNWRIALDVFLLALILEICFFDKTVNRYLDTKRWLPTTIIAAVGCLLSRVYLNEWMVSGGIFITTIVLFVSSLIWRYKRGNPITPNRILFVGTFLTAMFFVHPLYKDMYKGGWWIFRSSWWQSMQHAFRLFAIDGDFEAQIYEAINKREDIGKNIKNFYHDFGSFIYVVAPVLTFSFILSFFKNLMAHIKYFFKRLVSDVHIFSELNEKSCALAKNIKENSPRKFGVFSATIVFTDIIEKKEEECMDLIDGAKEIGAILFRKDLEAVNFSSLCNKYFYLISDCEEEKLRHAKSIMHKYDEKRASLYLFSDDSRAELLLSTSRVSKMRIKRVNDIQTLIYSDLNTNGINLYRNARKIDGEEDKVISAVIVGLGEYGREMLKALVWFCQLEGYKLKINAFETDGLKCERFKQSCPDLVNEFNRKKEEGLPYYNITIHNVDAHTPEFESEFREIDDATFVFVCLGKDNDNLNAAIKMRRMSERITYVGDGRKPAIETVIYDSNIKKELGVTWREFELNTKKIKLSGAYNHRKETYNILMIGDLDSFYSKGTMEFDRSIAWNVQLRYSLNGEKISYSSIFLEPQWLKFWIENKLNDWAGYISSYKVGDFSKLEELAKKLGKDEEVLKLRCEWENIAFKYFLDEITPVIKDTSLMDKAKFIWSTPLRIEICKILYKINRMLKKKPWDEEKWERMMAWRKKEEGIKKGAEEGFRYEYNYRSSATAAIHKKLLEKHPDLIGKENIKNWWEMDFQEKKEIGRIEQIRWCAYMRTEGFSRGKRNDLAKRHGDLVAINDLAEKTLIKNL